MEKYTDIYILGCSYMHSYGNWAELKQNSGQIHELSVGFPNARFTNLSYGGSSFANHQRVLVDTVLKNQPERLLLIWGLTFWYRFQLPKTNLDGARQIVHHNHLSASTEPSHTYVAQHYNHLLDNSEYYMHQNTQHITTITGWLKSLGHSYLVFNTADDFFANYISKNSQDYQHLLTDPDILSLTDFFLNDWLFAHGATPAPGDYDLVQNYRSCHYGSGLVPGHTEQVEQIQSKLIIEHFKEQK